MRDQHYHAGDASPAFSLRWAWTGWPSADVFPNPSSIDWKLLESLSVVPSMIVARLKGRLDHAFRTKGIPLKFSRKVALRSLGENTQADVDQYIANQVDKEQFVDDRFGASLKGVHTCLAEPSCRSTRSQFGALLVSIAYGTCR